MFYHQGKEGKEGFGNANVVTTVATVLFRRGRVISAISFFARTVTKVTAAAIVSVNIGNLP